MRSASMTSNTNRSGARPAASMAETVVFRALSASLIIAGEKLMNTVTLGGRWAASRIAHWHAARSSSWYRPASRALWRIASGSSGSPFRPVPRSSASCAKIREVSPTWTMGWKWLVMVPSSNCSRSQPVCAAT